MEQSFPMIPLPCRCLYCLFVALYSSPSSYFQARRLPLARFWLSNPIMAAVFDYPGVTHLNDDSQRICRFCHDSVDHGLISPCNVRPKYSRQAARSHADPGPWVLVVLLTNDLACYSFGARFSGYSPCLSHYFHVLSFVWPANLDPPLIRFFSFAHAVFFSARGAGTHLFASIEIDSVVEVSNGFIASV